MRKGESEKVLLAQLRENDENPRVITEDNLQKLIRSILIFPTMLDIRKIVLNADNVIIGGNMRFRALSAILAMSDEELSKQIDRAAQGRQKTDGEILAIEEQWKQWRLQPEVEVIRADFTDTEIPQFVIKDNVSAGEWDMDALESFDNADLEEWGVQTWGGISSFMDMSNETQSTPVCADRQRVIIIYPRGRENEIEQILSKELKHSYRLEEWR